MLIRQARAGFRLKTAVLLCGALSGCYFSIGFDSDAPTERLEITQQPRSIVVSAGQSASFVVGASGGPLQFQWQRNGSVILGATGSAYSTPPTTFADDGTLFTVRVCDEWACITSSPALLTVLRGQ